MKKILATLLLIASPVVAQPTVVIGNDRGGFINNRLDQMRDFIESGTRVEIRGKVCNSSCTMLLGLPDVCISADTTFGFHGPSYSGVPAPKHIFDYASELMAQNYPEPLRTYFMDVARYDLIALHKIKGEHIIAMGIEECD